MDPIRLGLSYRALRIRRGWRQADLADRSGVSRSLISRIERGGAGTMPLAALMRVARALEARVDVGLRWRGEQLDRLLDAAHADLVESVVDLVRRAGWEPAVEVSFAIFGERGSIDVMAMHPATGSLLVVEVKTVVPDSQALLHSLDRKARLAPRVASERGWAAGGSVGRLLVVADGSTARRRIAVLAATYGTALPDRGAAVRAWLRGPTGPLAGLLFLPSAHPEGAMRRPTGVARVRGRRRALVKADSVPSAQPGARMGKIDPSCGRPATRARTG